MELCFINMHGLTPIEGEKKADYYDSKSWVTLGSLVFTYLSSFYLKGREEDSMSASICLFTSQMSAIVRAGPG